MNPNSLFDVMLHSRSVIDKMRTVELDQVQKVEPTIFPASEVFEVFDFQSEIYKKSYEYRFKAPKGIMPLKGELFKLLKDAYRRRKNDVVTVEWPNSRLKSAAGRDAKAYISAIDTMQSQKLTDEASNFLVNSKEHLNGFLARIKSESVITLSSD